MKKLLSLGVAAAVFTGAALAAAGSASAFPYPPGPPPPHKHYKHYGHPAPAPFFFGFSFGPNLFYQPYMYQPYYVQPRVYGGNWNLHVSWCLDHYRTYNPHTNTYFRKVGVAAVCVSPFSY